MKSIMLIGALFLCAASSTQAQLLKKLKDKVNKAVGNDDKSTSSTASGADDNKSHWCDTISTNGTGADGVSYTKAYSGTGNFNIVYDESSMGLANNSSGYHLILSQYANGKTQFIVVENGKVIDTDTKVKPEYLGRGMRSAASSGNPGAADDAMNKYIVADSAKHEIPKTQATSVKTQKMNDDQLEMALNLMRQTDEYKRKSDAEKKELEETLKKGIAMNNSMAGQTINVPGSAGGSYSTITGYKLVVNGKTYGKFMMRPAVSVSSDGAMIFAVGADDKAEPTMINLTKKTPLDKTRFTGNGGMMIRSADLKKAVYIETKQMTESEISSASAAGFKMTFNALRPDGSIFTLTDYSGIGKFRLTSGGAVININEATGEVYSDNKKVGQFKLAPGEHLQSDAVLIGSSPSSIAYYNGSKGSLNYLDGTVRSLGIMYPNIVAEHGKTYMSWFRKCGSDIYIGRFVY